MRNWLKNKIVIKEIDGEEIKFQRIPVGILQKFKFLSDDVSKALSLVFKDTSKDSKFSQIQQGDATEIVHEAANPANIQLRKAQMEQGIKGIVDTLFADESFEILAEVIIHSAFEECAGATPQDIKDNMDPATAVQFLMGALEASAGDFAELGKSWCRKNPQLQALLDQKVPK